MPHRDTPDLATRFAFWQSLPLDPDRCPVRDVLAHLGDKWTTLIIASLAGGRSASGRSTGRSRTSPSGC